MFGFLGGAFSIDWRDRTLGIDWWQHEVTDTDTDDVARLGDDALDVLITHDSPAGINLLSSWRLPWIDRATTERTGELTWDSSRVVGLGCDGNTKHGWIILDLPNFEVNWPTTSMSSASSQRRLNDCQSG